MEKEKKLLKESVKKELKDTELVDVDRKQIFNTVVEVTIKSYSEISSGMTSGLTQIQQLRNTIVEVSADEQEIRRRAVNYFIKYGERPTPKALVFNWLQLDEVVQMMKENLTRNRHKT